MNKLRKVDEVTKTHQKNGWLEAPPLRQKETF